MVGIRWSFACLQSRSFIDEHLLDLPQRRCRGVLGHGLGRGLRSRAWRWECAVFDGPTKWVLSRGRIDSSIECHRTSASTDFVTRTYLKAE